ncbi:MAG: fumarylacetoacetate hydrolase family protein [Bacteroidales bacterium]|jgi:2-keto-4-pentenoate hydratase/2-oxohepta-3-ene-1,7-dioic acid hydratase in catechol pathway|nr:fumarylacetoacetate hydrolase family protein [Bacteroidales bacterium]NPV37071.1 fumarylacetoacetate hydrolase family protein [Bacteroidales bacterium]
MKIICIGRNYLAHIKELNNDLPEEPVFFMKPESALLPRRHPFYIPEFTRDLHYEGELVLRVSKLGKHISENFALNYIDAIAFGIDFTARDLQNKCKAKGLPWEIAKSWDFSAPVGTFIPISEFPDLSNIHFRLLKNGQIVQEGHSGRMIFPIPKLISYISRFITLKQGDYIFTGTPEGVGPVVSGDLLEGFIEDKKCFQLKIM